MPKGPTRRGQLISPSGVGAMIIARDGMSLLAAGLDHWHKHEHADSGDQVNLEEYLLEEWRLQKLLKVDHFRLPPDYRRRRVGVVVPNSGLTVPFLRFPQWHFCPSCHYLKRLPLTARQRTKCERCAQTKKTRFILQVPIVAMCDKGHLQDFPWAEWAHSQVAPACQMAMRLVSTGGATLGAQRIECECGKGRTLNRVTEADPQKNTSFVTSNLDPSAHFPCPGMTPWLGTETGRGCGSPLKGSLRSAANVYFANQASAIYLPRKGELASSELVGLCEDPPFSTFIKILKDSGVVDVQPTMLRSVHPTLLTPYSDREIQDALNIIKKGKEAGASASEAQELDDASFRFEEYEALRSPKDEEKLLIREVGKGEYDSDVVSPFSRILLVHKLRETRALAGFSRVLPENGLSLQERKDLLWRTCPQGKNAWLPAYVVHGEGLFIEFDLERLREWEGRASVRQRVNPLLKRIRAVQEKPGARRYEATPALVMIHTFSHVLMNRLTFECGYSSAALRERLYVSSDPKHPMAAVLVYTAAGDAEGTMGGLVRMGKPGNLEPVIRRALEGAEWCSADPICMELGSGGGQGPDSCNLAACHNCSLVPETACEYFNRMLDRALLVGDIGRPDAGFFVG